MICRLSYISLTCYQRDHREYHWAHGLAAFIYLTIDGYNAASSFHFYRPSWAFHRRVRTIAGLYLCSAWIYTSYFQYIVFHWRPYMISSKYNMLLWHGALPKHKLPFNPSFSIDASNSWLYYRQCRDCLIPEVSNASCENRIACRWQRDNGHLIRSMKRRCDY